MPEQGKSSRQAVQTLINAMDKYNEGVTAELKSLLKETRELGLVWNDPQYDAFAEFMVNSVVSLNKELGVLKEAGDRLKKKLNMYDE